MQHTGERESRSHSQGGRVADVEENRADNSFATDPTGIEAQWAEQATERSGHLQILK